MNNSLIDRNIRLCAMWCQLIVIIGQVFLIPALYLLIKAINSMGLADDMRAIWGVNLLLLLLIVDFCWSIGLVFIVWRLNIHRHQLIEMSGKEIINFLLSLILYLIVIDTITMGSCGLCLRGHASILLIPIFLLSMIAVSLNLTVLLLTMCITITGSIQAAKGKIYDYPFTIRFL